MTNGRRPLTWLVGSVLVLAGCGGGDEAGESSTTIDTPSTTGATSDPGSVPTTTAPSGGSSSDTDATPGSDLCTALDQDDPPTDLADLVPPEYAAATQTLLDIAGSFESIESSIPSDLIDRLASSETGNGLAALADLAERQCGPSESVDGMRAYAQISGLADPTAQPDYCEQLATVLSLEASDDESASALTAALNTAPAEHIQALTTLQAVIASDAGIPDDLDPIQALVATAGLGLYAEARCGVADSFATMLFVGAFLSAGEDFPGETPQGVGAVPEPADPGPAISAVPADSDVMFEVLQLDLEDDGEYLVSAVVPAGWERRDRMFGAMFEPVEGFGFFAELTIDSGCDGMCEVTDWDARLNGPDGYVTRYREGGGLIVDRPTEGTAGIVMTKPGFDEFVEGVVIRWANDADRYFTCDFRLSTEDVDLVDAFVAACEAARPGWIIGL